MHKSSKIDLIDDYILPVLPLLVIDGGLGLGGGVDFPNECFLGEAFVCSKTGSDTGCLEAEASFFSGLGLKLIFSELPFNFSRLDEAEFEVSMALSTEDFLLLICGAAILAPVFVVGFLILACKIILQC